MYCGDEVADHRDEAQQVAEHREPEAPEHRADEVVERVASARHLADARGDRREGADDRDEAGDDDGQAAVAREERVRPLDVLDAEQTGFLAFEDGGAALVADQVADFTAEESRERDRRERPPRRSGRRRRSGTARSGARADPEMTRSVSPGSRKPMRRPVSAKMMKHTTSSAQGPAHSMMAAGSSQGMSASDCKRGSRRSRRSAVGSCGVDGGASACRAEGGT